MSLSQAAGVVDSWLNQPTVRVVEPPEGFWPVYARFLRQAGRGGNLANDAWLAALAYVQGAVMASGDTDFASFPDIRWLNPLTDGARA